MELERANFMKRAQVGRQEGRKLNGINFRLKVGKDCVTFVRCK